MTPKKLPKLPSEVQAGQSLAASALLADVPPRPGLHRCLLCRCWIREEEVYCWHCGTVVWATRGNAEEYSGEYADRWKELRAKIDRAIAERESANDQAQRPGLTAGVERNKTKGKTNE